MCISAVRRQLVRPRAPLSKFKGPWTVVQAPDFQTFMFDWSGRVSRTVKKFFFALVAITLSLTGNASFAEDVYYCELINSVVVDSKNPDQVKQYSGNRFKFALQSDKIKFSDGNNIFSEEYELSSSTDNYLKSEVEFSQTSPTKFNFKEIRSFSSGLSFSVESISFEDGKLFGMLHLFNQGGVNYSYSKCDKF